MVRFTASQSIHLSVDPQPIPVGHYLRQPRRLINALMDMKRVDVLGDGRFRLTMRPLKFMMLHIQPTVDLQIDTEANGRIQLYSTGCQIRGNQYVNQRFDLHLKGHLAPICRQDSTHLEGTAHLVVEVELPPALRFTPRSLLETTGNGLLKSILMTIKQRLSSHLLSDYYQWVQSQLNDGQDPSTLSSSLHHQQSQG
ncbi:hypothetical protein XM38_009020 [Halomicronema hongdechloris C2206]|uniref:DUF1997 domain-containing protein n=1 Tax=Halomicronema hongdechloris C2206 TaxID=1641165 RepID=A0A1Z3HI22_9CYAN|nr:DUF1997 domain-containing protein [Halomicronema hongdechloris]ASC69972.1 hypothetical protein XM38_009020 [Halomicronema hongdechloris C2206]